VRTVTGEGTLSIVQWWKAGTIRDIVLAEIAGSWYVANAIIAYKKNSRPFEKSNEEKKDEEIRIKPMSESGCGTLVDILA
jgi:hypothetical protein